MTISSDEAGRRGSGGSMRDLVAAAAAAEPAARAAAAGAAAAAARPPRRSRGAAAGARCRRRRRRARARRRRRGAALPLASRPIRRRECRRRRRPRWLGVVELRDRDSRQAANVRCAARLAPSGCASARRPAAAQLPPRRLPMHRRPPPCALTRPVIPHRRSWDVLCSAPVVETMRREAGGVDAAELAAMRAAAEHKQRSVIDFMRERLAQNASADGPK